MAALLNNTFFQFDWDVINGEYRGKRYDLEAASINEHGLASPWKCESKGIYSDLYSDSIITRRVARLFLRYKNGPVSFKARVGMAKFKWDAGDIIRVTHSKLPNIATGVRGIIGQLMEIVSMKPNPSEGSIDLEIMDTRLGGKAGMITPNDFPSYIDASDEQRQWAFICDSTTLLMPNGDAATLII